METDQRYVIFYCDDCSLLKSVIKIFTDIHKNIRVLTFSEIDELITQVQKKKPELILVYFQDAEKSYIEVVKKIRENIDTTSIPVRIYRELPDEHSLQTIFKAL